MTEEHLVELLSRMTLAEKLGQMHAAHEITDANIQAALEGRVGTLLNPGHWKEGGLLAKCNRLQRAMLEKSRLGIPLLLGRDVIHGYRTIMPIPLGQAASFNEELVEEAAIIAGDEARAHGINWTFAPMVDVSRDPRWGRVAESCGEEPHLNARLGAAMVRGFNEAGVAACAKHYAGYGAAEGGRDYNTTWIPENHLRNVYLPPFLACVEAGVPAVMSAFNDLGGIPASGNELTLRTILKGEWEFDGLVISDWDSVIEMVRHGYAADDADAARKAIAAGVDIEMVSTAYAAHVEKLIAEGKLSMAMVDDAVMRVLRVKNDYGLFEEPCSDDEGHEEEPDPEFYEESRLTAQNLAEESCVLLTNDGVLPLENPLRLAVIGPLANAPVEQCGCWVTDADYETVSTPLAALREFFHGEIDFVAGLETCHDASTAQFEAAADAAARADAAIVFIGEEAFLSGESHCRAYLDFPGAQLQLLEAVAARAKKVCVVVMAGRPLVLGRVAELANALLYAWHPGTMGGPAIARLLSGQAVPSGKCPISFPRCEGQIPVYMGSRNTGRPAPENGRAGVPAGTPLDPSGFCSVYLDCDTGPLYPFGFGLSYTTFEYSRLELSRTRLKPGGKIDVSVTVKNTGKRDAVEVVQLYIRDLVGSVTRPLKELKDFQRIPLRARQFERVHFEVTADDLMFYNAYNEFVLEPGAFTLFIGGSSVDCLSANFEVVDS